MQPVHYAYRHISRRRSPRGWNRIRGVVAPVVFNEGMTLEKPVIELPGGEAPKELDILDIVVGEGPEAVPGGTVEVHYVGVQFKDGYEFDASWNRGETIKFPLRGLIKGWQEGIPGMKVGGRRQLTIPPSLAYGEKGSGHQLSGETLVFIIDLLGVS
jgi:peptidylprolyl isomerase